MWVEQDKVATIVAMYKVGIMVGGQAFVGVVEEVEQRIFERTLGI
jgi:hypothetical protein